MAEHPAYLHTVLDCERPRELAEFYRQLLGLVHRAGDEQVRTTWPEQAVPQQLHVDYTVGDVEALERHKDTALRLGAELRLDRTDDEDEPLYVLADPAGHPFCLFVG